MTKTQNFGDISYHQYPKIYLEAIKGLTKSLVVKKQNNVDTKINDCIREYKKLLKKMGYSNIKDEIDHFINFATKIASWYEMKFPDPKTHNLFLNKDLKLTPEFFVASKDPIYNTAKFFDTYIPNEKYMILEPSYSQYIFLDNRQYFEVSSKGIIKNTNINNKRLYIGKHISKVQKISQRFGIEIKNIDKINEEIQTFEDKTKLREILLDTIMYIIIKRGGIRIGPRRSLLFAKEFNRNIDIPMQYGIDTTDAYDITLIKVYLNNGGKKNLELFINYFSEGIENIMFDKMTINEYINHFASEDIDFYTKEQLEEYKKDLYQRMVKSLNNRKLELKLENKNEDKK